MLTFAEMLNLETVLGPVVVVEEFQKELFKVELERARDEVCRNPLGDRVGLDVGDFFDR